jgi:hypothetical protein
MELKLLGISYITYDLEVYWLKEWWQAVADWLQSGCSI